MSSAGPFRFARYAAGEILLLVVGILIALQIDGWHEERQEREREAYYLERLETELEFNAAEAERNIAWSERQVRFAELLLQSLDGELEEAQQVEWLYALNYLWFLPHPFYDDAAWSELKSTGEVGLIRNRDLAERIGTFHSQLSHVMSLEGEWGSFHLSFRAAVNDVLDDDLRREVVQGLGSDGIIGRIDRRVDISPYIDRLRAIDGIEGLIRDIWINRRVAVEVHGARKTDIEGILQIL
ncbi:MAG: hypothetical protein R3323_02255, partial [Wenzhouxiangellaceae bacterium]|nr:hypothetical protein [Wenzhouxiangellaceae bacterium]